MLWFIGMGISGFRSIPNKALDIIKKADIVYLEQFTSPIAQETILEITSICNKTKQARRWMVEDGTEILENAKEKNVVLLSYGDPFMATTHTDLRVRASTSGTKTRVIHASSSITSMIGECGLHFYKMGRAATIMRDSKSMTTPYYIIYRNLIEGNHTILLLEYDREGGDDIDGDKEKNDSEFFLDPKDALTGLLDTEKGQRRGVVTMSTYAIVASRIGLDNQTIISGMVSSLMTAEFGDPPHTVIIPGRLHFTESDAIVALAKCLDMPPDNNINNSHKNIHEIKRISLQMIEKYAPMVRKAIEDTRFRCAGDTNLEKILENAELYVQDAEEFLEVDGHDEVAVLSIGYADGLVDALQMMAKRPYPGLDTINNT